MGLSRADPRVRAPPCLASRRLSLRVIQHRSTPGIGTSFALSNRTEILVLETAVGLVTPASGYGCWGGLWR